MRPAERSTFGTAVNVNGITTGLRPSPRSSSRSPPPKSRTPETMPQKPPSASQASSPSEIGVEILVFLQFLIGQAGAVDEQLETLERLGGGAVVDAAKPHHQDRPGQAVIEDLEATAVGCKQRAVIAEPHRILGERLDPHLAAQALGRADDANENGVSKLGHGHLRVALNVKRAA